MASVKIIGKVAVKVMPDVTDFKQVLKKKLNEIEKSLDDMKVKIVADLDKAMKEKIKKEMQRLKDDLEKRNVKLTVELNNGSVAKVAAVVAALTKKRTINVDLDLDKSSLLGIGTALAALTGGRVLNSFLGDTMDYLKNFDKHIPKIAAVGTALVGLAGAALSSATNIFTIGLGIVQMSGALIPLPGILAGIAIGAGITIAAFKDFNTVLPEVKERLSDLQDSLSTNFWAEAKAPIRDFIDSLWPEFSAGVNDAATEIGAFFGGWATEMTKAFQNNDSLKGMFASLSDSIEVMSGHTDSFATIIARLGEIGASWLPDLAGWFGDMSDKFAKFLTDTTDSQFNEWIQTGIDNVQAFGTIIGNVAGILAGLSAAAEAAGGTSLQMLAEKLQSVEDIVKGNTFQTNLIDLLTAASNAMDFITNGTGKSFGDFLIRLSDTLTEVLPIAAEAISTAFTAIFDALDNPDVQDGIVKFFEGVRDGVEKLAPHMPALADAFAKTAPLAGALARQIGTVLGEAIEFLAPLVSKLAPKITKFVDAMEPYAGYIAAAVLAMGGFKIAKIVFDIGVVIVNLGLLAGAWVATAATAIASMFETMAIMALYVIDALAAVGTIILAQASLALAYIKNAIWAGVYYGILIAGWVASAAAAVVNTAIMVATTVGGWIVMAASAIAGAAAMAAAWLIAFWPIALIIVAIAAVIAIVILVVKNWDWLKEKAGEIWDWISEKIGQVWDWIKEKTGEAVEWVKTTAANAWESIKSKAAELWDKIKDAVIDKWDALKQKIAEKVLAIKEGIAEKWDAIKQAAIDKWESVKTAVSDKVEAMKAAVSEKVESIKTAMSDAWENVKTKTSDAWEKVKTSVSEKIADVVQYAKDLPGKITGAIGDLGNLLWDAGVALMAGLLGGINKKWEEIKSSVSAMAGWIKDHKGPISYDKVLLKPAGEAIMDGLLKSMESRYKGIADSLTGLTNDIANSLTGGADYKVGIAASLDTSGMDLSAMKGISASVSNSISAPASGEAAAGNVQIDNISIPLEDLAQLKTLEEFLDMLRVRTRQGVVLNG